MLCFWCEQETFMKGLLNMFDWIIAICAIATASLAALGMIKKAKNSLPTIEIEVIDYPSAGNGVYLALIKIHPAKEPFTFTDISVKDGLICAADTHYENYSLGSVSGIFQAYSPVSGFTTQVKEIISVPSNLSSKTNLTRVVFIKPLSSDLSTRISLNSSSAFPWHRVSKKVLIKRQTD